MVMMPELTADQTPPDEPWGFVATIILVTSAIVAIAHILLR